MTIRLIKLAFGAVLAAGASNAFAGITLVSGPGTLRTNPNDMKYKADAYQASTFNYWAERMNHRLSSDLVISMQDPASYPTNVTSHINNESTKIAMGTNIDSYYIYWDPENASGIARFRFNAPILGVITNERTNATNNHFMLSDYLIDPLVPVANKSTTHFNARGLEIGSNEYIRWIANNEIELHFTATSPGDQIRVITAAVPEPASMMALGIGAVALVRRRRKGNRTR